MRAFNAIVFLNVLLSFFMPVKASHRASSKEILRACTILNIRNTDDVSESLINKQYKTLAKNYHPDRYPGPKEKAEELFKEINAAHALLLDNMDHIKHASGSVNSTFNWREYASTSTSTDGLDSNEDMCFDDIWQSAVKSPRQQVSPEKLALRGIFTTGFVKNTIFWMNEERSESSIAREWASEHITPGMRRCFQWLALMAYARSNNWRHVQSILQTDPKLVNMHDETADALSLCESVLVEGLPGCLRGGHERVREVLLSHGAVARFPSYRGGMCGFADEYMY